MATQVQFRRGTTAQNDAFTGAVGEITVDTTLSQVRIHDGSQAGGFAAGFETGTVMLFHQDTAPSGWNKDTNATLNDHALRVVTSTSWGTGVYGSGIDFTAALGATGIATQADAGSAPSHTHTMQTTTGATGGSLAQQLTLDKNPDQSAAAGGGTHSHDMDMDINYINLIRATKA